MGLRNPKIAVMCFVGVEPVVVMCFVGVGSVWIASAAPPAQPVPITRPLTLEAVSLNSTRSHAMVSSYPLVS